MMIQVSPPIHSIESPEARQSAPLSPDHKTEGKEDSGVFARLLAGLLQKTDKSGALSGLPGAEKLGTGEGGEGLAPDRDAGETGEGGEVSRNLEGSRKGKKRGASLAGEGEPAERRGKTDVLSGADKKGVKSHSPEGAEGELAADLVRAHSVLEAGGSMEGETPVVQAGEEDLAANSTDGGGEETPDTDAPGKGDGRILAEASEEELSSGQDRFIGQDHFFSEEDRNGSEDPSAGENRLAGLRDLPARELSQYAAGDLPAQSPNSGRASRFPVRETVEKDGRSPGGMRVRDRRRDRSSPEAGDIRVGLDKRDGAESFRSLAEAGRGGDGSQDSGRETELVVELRSMGKTQAEISADRENRPVQSFQNTLARELHENLNGDIVRHASVMLRDGGEGTIRLSLRPETLGNVKIRLEITENKIAGRIIVESGEAFKAFEQELHSLEQSFRDSGFDDASLEMAFASDGREGQQRGEADDRFSGRLVALRYDAAVSSGDAENLEGSQWLGMRRDGQGRAMVNMLV